MRLVAAGKKIVLRPSASVAPVVCAVMDTIFFNESQK